MIARYGLSALLALIAGIYLSCSDKSVDPPPPLPPAPQLFAVLSTTDFTANLNWYYPTDEESGFYLYMRAAGSWARYDTLPASASVNVNHTVGGLNPGSTYYFRVTAFNENGESGWGMTNTGADSVTAHTTGTFPPEPPINIHAVAIGAGSVQVHWIPVGTQDGFRIDRHEPLANWSTIGTAGGTASAFTDSNVAALTTYYYRVGSFRNNVVSWSLDSAVVTTPDGPPLAPDSLEVSSLPGIGVRLTWVDHSENETGFHISRNYSGQNFVTIDSVAANVTTYFDSLSGAVDNYNYRVRAFNSFGASAWTSPVPVHYDLCSDGVIPLCVGNWWQYHVTDSAGPDYDMHRNIRSIAYPGGLDYYLTTTQLEPPVSPEDTLYYLRNFSDGCWKLDFPLNAQPRDQLFKYPATVGQFYFADGDCVLVAGTGINIDVNGTLYTNVSIYQRFYSPTHSVQIYVEPVTVGIIREQEFINDSPTTLRDLTNSYIQND